MIKNGQILLNLPFLLQSKAVCSYGGAADAILLDIIEQVFYNIGKEAMG